MSVNQQQAPDPQQLQQAAAAGDVMAALELGSHLLENSAPNSADYQRGLQHLQSALDSPQAAYAHWALAAHWLQHMTLPAPRQKALEHLQQAAAAGLAPAMDRLANQYLRGIGLEFAPQRAMRLLQSLADGGFQRFAWDLGYLHSLQNDAAAAADAAAAFARACAMGYPPAYYSLGMRFAGGHGVARDVDFARALLLRAADAGFPDARRAAEALSAQADHAACQQWYTRLQQNLAAAQQPLQSLQTAGMLVDDSLLPVIRRLEAHFASLGHPSLRIGADQRLQVLAANAHQYQAAPQAWQWHAQQPRIATSDEFISDEEAAHLQFLVAAELAPPETYTTAASNSQTENSFFTGLGRSFGALSSDTVVRTIERRIAAATDWDLTALEPSSVIRYQPGHEYRPHVDYFTSEQIAQNKQQLEDFSGQRVVTFLICMEAPLQGGETLYDRVGVRIGYRRRMAAMHFNTAADGKPEPLSLHSGTPVLAGEKWLLRTTLREFSRYQS